jgi:hypothetical protein
MLRSAVTSRRRHLEMCHFFSPTRSRYRVNYRNLPIAVGSALLIVLAGCAGYEPGRQAYWDARVREMCNKDGGVRVFEQIHISKAEIDLLGRVDGKIAVPAKRLAHPKSTIFAENKITHIRASNPAVWRSEWAVVRREDRVVVAQWVSYVRVGGDPPTYAHPSTFICPNPGEITSDLQELFVVEEFNNE